MEPLRWSRLQALFLDALDVPPAERAAFLDRACAAGTPDEALRPEVERMLRAHTDAGEDSLDSPFALGPEAPQPLTERVGPWQPGRLLGAGGMGVVYAAERADGAFAQHAALKLLHPGTSAAFKRRFLQERQILAGLEHPGIARLLDGGVAPDGRPYLAMERVDGEPLTAYAGGRPLKEKLALFLQVCDAVAYAHRNLVVHRDLKPSNILVAEDGAGRPLVKLLDFGVAKLLRPATDEGDTAPPTLLTREGSGPLTPHYAAPEQLTGEPVTTATDVYALGVLLYELLAGARPYALQGLSAAQVERAVAETVPARPSAVPGAPAFLKGDLDTIVMKALAKEPERRYAGAEALAADLRRYLQGRTVEARPASAGYRLRRFAQRHRVGVGLAAAAALVLVGLVTAFTLRLAQERDRAERRFALARDVANALLYDVSDNLANLDGTTPAREAIVELSLEYLDALRAEAGPDADLRAEVAAAYLRAGNILGNPNEANLGRTDEAAARYRDGLAVLPPEHETTPPQVRHLRAVLLEKLAAVEAARGRPDEALALSLRSTALFRANRERDPVSADRALPLVWAYMHLGDYAGHPAFPNVGRPAEALAYYDSMEAAIAATRSLEGADPVTLLRTEGIVLERRGVLLLDRGDIAEGLDSFRRSAELRERLARQAPEDYQVRRDAGIAREKLADAYREAGMLEAALQAYREAEAVYRRLAEANPQSEQAQRTLAIGLFHLGDVLGGVDGPGLGRRAEARAAFSEARALLAPLAAQAPSNESLAGLLAEADRSLQALAR